MACEYLSANLMANQLVPLGQFLPLQTASEPVTLAEPPTVLLQQETPPSVSAPPTTSPASTPSALEPPPVISPQRSGPLLCTQSDGPSYPPLASPSPLSVLRHMKTKSYRTKVMLVHHTSSGHRNEDFWQTIVNTARPGISGIKKFCRYT